MGVQPYPQFVWRVMLRQLFGQKFGCYLGKLWGKNENLVIIWAKFDIKKIEWNLAVTYVELRTTRVNCLLFAQI